MTLGRHVTVYGLVAAVASLLVTFASAFVSRPTFLIPSPQHATKRRTRLYGNFFQDMLKDAFANDSNLSSDKSAGQLEGPGDDTALARSNTLTKTQMRWREANPKVGAPIRPELLVNTCWDLDLFLAGVPSKDPSNDLYGSKTNISSRDREVGLDLPSEPSVTVRIQLLEGGVCKADKTAFTAGTLDGQWKLSEDGRDLRISIDVIGYSRTVQTKGSITKVYWSDSEEVTRQTSSSYNIPPGWIYGDISVQFGAKPGSILMSNDGGVLRVEETMGLLGASSKMVPCGRFTARPVTTDN